MYEKGNWGIDWDSLGSALENDQKSEIAFILIFHMIGEKYKAIQALQGFTNKRGYI